MFFYDALFWHNGAFNYMLMCTSFMYTIFTILISCDSMLMLLISTKQKVKLKLLKYLLQMTNGTLVVFVTGNNKRSLK